MFEFSCDQGEDGGLSALDVDKAGKRCVSWESTVGGPLHVWSTVGGPLCVWSTVGVYCGGGLYTEVCQLVIHWKWRIWAQHNH